MPTEPDPATGGWNITLHDLYNAWGETWYRITADGGEIIDTAPMYRSSETVLGELIAELGIRDSLFMATKSDRDVRDGGTLVCGVSSGRVGVSCSFLRR